MPETATSLGVIAHLGDQNGSGPPEPSSSILSQTRAWGAKQMIVEQVWTANDYRNFNYLIACPETGAH